MFSFSLNLENIRFRGTDKMGLILFRSKIMFEWLNFRELVVKGIVVNLAENNKLNLLHHKQH